MLYYNDNEIIIRDMKSSDAQIITEGEIAQGWQATVDKYEMRLMHQAEGKAISLVAEYKGEVAGYINVYPDSGGGVPLQEQDFPRLWILVCWRSLGGMASVVS